MARMVQVVDRTLAAELRQQRLASYARLGGGWPVPLAGAVWWVGLAWLGTVVAPNVWSPVAFAASGVIFPLALLFARLAGNGFMRDRTVVTGVLFPAFASMLLFWAIAVAALWEANHLTPLVLAVGMAIHWPVIGWSYGRTAPFVAHAAARAVLGFLAWHLYPDARFTLVPLVVAAIYLVTVLFLLADTRWVARRLRA